MKICPRCELNYIDDDEELCDVCYADKTTIANNRNYGKSLVAGNMVSVDLIQNKVSANAIYQSVRYLSYDYGEYSIYDTKCKHSYRNLLYELQTRFHYAKHKYPAKAGFEYVFESEDIWRNFFLNNEDFRQTINHRKISNLEELIRKATYWHSLPYKRR